MTLKKYIVRRNVPLIERTRSEQRSHNADLLGKRVDADQ